MPTQVPLQRSKPYLLARALGATVGLEVDSTTTHLVAARLGTAKVTAARSRQVAVVTPDWLWACAERWERVEERLFPLSRHCEVTRRPPAHCSSPEIAFAERCSDLDLNLDGAAAGAFGRQPSVAEADPFLSFSSEDLAGMDKDVEDALSESGESDSDESTGDRWAEGGGSSSEDSLQGTARGHKRGREGEEQDGERGVKRRAEEEEESEESGGEEEWDDMGMGAELERELGN